MKKFFPMQKPNFEPLLIFTHKGETTSSSKRDEFLNQFPKYVFKTPNPNAIPSNVAIEGLDPFIKGQHSEYNFMLALYVDYSNKWYTLSKQIHACRYADAYQIREQAKYIIAEYESCLTFYQNELDKIHETLDKIAQFREFVCQSGENSYVNIAAFFEDFLNIQDKHKEEFNHQLILLRNKIKMFNENYTLHIIPPDPSNLYQNFIYPTSRTGRIFQRFLNHIETIQYNDFQQIVNALSSPELECSENIDEKSVSQSMTCDQIDSSSKPRRNSISVRSPNTISLQSSRKYNYSSPSHKLPDLQEKKAQENIELISESNKCQFIPSDINKTLPNQKSLTFSREWVEDTLFDVMWSVMPYPMGQRTNKMLPELHDVIPAAFDPKLIPSKWTMKTFDELYNCNWPLKPAIDQLFELLLITNPFKIAEVFFNIIENISLILCNFAIEAGLFHNPNDVELDFDSLFTTLLICVFVSGLSPLLQVFAYAGSFSQYAADSKIQYALSHMDGLYAHISELDVSQLKNKTRALLSSAKK